LWQAMKKPPKGLFLITGPNVLRTRDHAVRVAERVAAVKQSLGVEVVFKASFDKANRTSAGSFRGPGMDEGLRIFEEVKRQTQLPVITDIHETWQAAPVAEVADIVQIPAFMCRQTDLLKAAAETGRIINIKKGQFASPSVMEQAAHKVKQFGNDKVMLCERGTTFGYTELIVDPMGLVEMKESGFPVVLDATHSLQRPSSRTAGASGGVVSGGERRYLPDMGMVGAALGVEGVFVEVDDDVAGAPCDGQLQWPVEDLLPVAQKWLRMAQLRSELDGQP